jgi:uncharacterized membrane protein
MNGLFLTPINLVLAAAIAIAAITGFVLIPAGAALPVHWGLDLRPDSWQPREIALLVGPALGVSIGVLLVLMRLYGSRGQSDRAVPVIRITFTLILVLALAIEIAIVWYGLGGAAAASG